MDALHVFVSHASANDAVVARLRNALEDIGVSVWTDSQHLSGGVPLEEEIFQAIETADHFLVLISLASLDSKWVEKEIRRAQDVQKKRGCAYKVIPILLDDVTPKVLSGLFGAEPVAVKLSSDVGGVHNALPELLAALGLRMPDDAPAARTKPAVPMAELTLMLSDPRIDRTGGTHRAAGAARLKIAPPDGSPPVESKGFKFIAPLGPIEAGEIEWYLERYAHWPMPANQERARKVEQDLPKWGRLLFDSASGGGAGPAIAAWLAAGKKHPRRFTVLVDPDPTDGSAPTPESAEAATLLLSLPWEIVHDERDYLFRAAPAVQVRRRLPNREQRDPVPTAPPIRILLLSPRPEDDHAAYLDHRASARPVVEALAELGELAQLTILAPPTFGALEAELRRAHEAGTSYHVVHFDGHGVYDQSHGLGALCFEHADDRTKLEKRKSHIVDAEELARVVEKYRVPLFFLEACESAVAKTDPTASVAGRLLQHGVNSVVAMSHSVLVETARRFVIAFYRALVEGERVGRAMLAGQVALKDDPLRGKTFIGPLKLEDWFVPVLFQEEVDPQLIAQPPAARVQAILKQQRAYALGRVPAAPFGFVGRSRELLMAERLLEQSSYAVLLGQGGEGKTTLAAELARWLLATGRFRRAAFVSVETHADMHSVLHALGEQLVPDYVKQAAQDDKRGIQLIERALIQTPTLLVFDNMESVLPPAPGSAMEAAFEPEVLEKILGLCAELQKLGRTHLVFTTREAMPAPFEQHHVAIGRLDRRDAVELVGKVLGEDQLLPGAADLGTSDAEIDDLVDAVNCHARSLVLLPREILQSGVKNATQQLHELMAALHERHPDDRERSLLASVELSLRRVPTAIRQKLGPLGVFHGGGHLITIAMVLGLDVEKHEQNEVAKHLIHVGLAEAQPYGYLQLNPGLGLALLKDLSDTEREAAQNRWAEATAEFTDFLYQQQYKNAQMASTLALLDLPNLLAGLEHLHKSAEPDRVVGVASRIEQLVATLGRPKALARAVRVRAASAPKPGVWNHAAFEAADAAVDRLLESGRLTEAVAAARRLLKNAEAGGYPEAAYDLAVCYLKVGRTLEMGGDAESALVQIAEARRRLEILAQAGEVFAAQTVSVCHTEAGDCLVGLGRLDEAAEAYEASIKIAEEFDDPRQAAVGKCQLGTVRMLEGRYSDAVTAYNEARKTFAKLGEPGNIGIAWHQIGMVHRLAGQYDAAERAFQNSLKISVQLVDRSGEASTLLEFGTLYHVMGKLEDAVRFYSQAAGIYSGLDDPANEGSARNNTACTLVKLTLFDEARQELLRAIECDKSFGHAAEPWKTFANLRDLEHAVGNNVAADAARQQTIEAFLAYRRAGGENHDSSGRWATAVAAAIAENQIAAAASGLAELLTQANLSAGARALIGALQAILAGSRDPALAADPNLNWDGAAEVVLLLESLAAGSSS